MSLTEQLSQISANNSTVALDRKRRQKLHSASLIYNPKTAATQDYDLIYENAVEALQELVEIDGRFDQFNRSLFGASSVSIDRNVQTKDQVKNLDTAVNQYLMLASSKWHLTPTLHATEWLVRRFQIHVHNAECLLLSTINYFQSPIFRRILNIVKIPPLFNPLSNFVRSEQMPSNLTIVKMFDDQDFLKLYTQHLSKTIKRKVTYTSQLLFASCSIVNLIAFNSTNQSKLEALVPTLLELSAKLLTSELAEAQVAAHTILVVFATAFPLNKSIIVAAEETILAGLAKDGAKRSALITICKLHQSLKGQGNVDQLSLALYKSFSAQFSFPNVLAFLEKQEKNYFDKFFTSYIRAIVRYDHDRLPLLVELLIKTKFEKYELRFIIVDLINLSEVLENKSQLGALFELLIGIDEELVLECLKNLNINSEVFELRLTRSLFQSTGAEAEDDDIQISRDASKVSGLSKPEEPFKDFLNRNSQWILTKSTSVLTENDEKFGKLLSLFVESLNRNYQPGLFLSTFFTTIESRLSFLLRVIVSPASPSALKLISLSNISKLLNQIDSESNVFTIVPLLMAALCDATKTLRAGISKLMLQISKRPTTKHYFYVNQIYGEREVPMLAPKEGSIWLNNFLENFAIENIDAGSLIIPKKHEKAFLLFWANQALHVPLPSVKMRILNWVTKHHSYSSAYSIIFLPLVGKYLKERQEWEDKCLSNKTNFEEYERSIVAIIAGKEKNGELIEFALSALKSNFQQLATLMSIRLQKVFSTLKTAQQQDIVKSIVESTAEQELYYDSVGLLQSLPINASIFATILKSLRINTDDSQDDFVKRRRRSSTANKAALQKEEISHMAEIHLRKLTIVLEALDSAKDVGSPGLLSALFGIIADLETLALDGGLPVLYAQESLASCMMSTIDVLKKNEVTDTSSIRADALIAAITSSQSPQVQNKLLLVVASLAGLNSEIVLHSVMPIFIFMGAHTIRQDDEFSTFVVDKTIKTVIPSLVESGSNNKEEEVEFLLMSFATAFPHVPKHRRVKLYSTLIETLSTDKSLGPFIFLMAQQYAQHITKFKVSEAKAVVEFMVSLLTKMNAADQLLGFDMFLQLMKVISPDLPVDEKEGLESKTLFSNGILNSTIVEMVGMKNHFLEFLNKILNDQSLSRTGDLKIKVLQSLWDSESTSGINENMKSLFGFLLEHTLEMIDSMENYNLGEYSPDTKELADEMSEQSYIFLRKILDLLPIDDFVDAVLPLMRQSNRENLRHHVTISVASKFDLEVAESASSASKIATALIDTATDAEETVIIIQVSLNTLGALVTKFGQNLEHELLMRAMTTACDVLLRSESDLKIAALTVITSVIQTVGIKSIALYPRIVPPSIKIFAEIEENDCLREQLQLAILLMFSSMIKRMPGFLLSHLAEILKIILSAEQVEESIRLSILALMVSHIEVRDILRTLSKVWSGDIKNSSDSIAVSLFLSCLESVVDVIDKKSAAIESPVFFRLLLSFFEYRTISKFDTNTVNRIEASAHKVANSYVLKLNDKVFRPLFALTVRWAFDGEGVQSFGVTRVERLTAFFRFFNKLQENLKSIITSYFTYLLDQTIELLHSFVKGETVDLNLRRLVLNSLTSCFKYDQEEYWKSTSRFEVISEALIAQLSNIEDSVAKYLVKAISSLAVSNAGAEDHNKIMNTLLMSHMKASCRSKEKLWASRSIKAIYSKVGENWLALLPQLVPIIAELLEDDNDEVEYEVRTGLVKVVENVLGEPFDRYLD
ncbi:LAMI_0E12134g1_1 [Lachancea mirantina]|uniref:U3 small nucleolar RNA-associated protein 10 n=1 Tax=Lachancea mirantina TaxID=1230905 RepID=A0A1G4JPZ9_9SACH|nr:LAMI_0E12134g1_1 [Lachancea mirantina]